MKLFDILGGKVVIHSDALGIPCFKRVWDTDKADKEHATKIISYIVLKNKWDSPYVQSMDIGTIENTLKKEIFGNINYELTKDEEECERMYKRFCYTRTLEMLDNMRLKLDSISKYYKESLDDELDEKKIKDLLAGMTSVGNVLKSIDTLENMVKAEEVSIGKVKGDSKINPYELVK